MITLGSQVRGVLRDVAEHPIVRDLLPNAPGNPLTLFFNEQNAKAGMQGLGGYFGGQSLTMQGGKVALTAADASVAKSRMIAAGTVAGLGAANMMDYDPLGATTVVNTAGRGGIHLLMAAPALRTGGKARAVGLGYLGLGALNIFHKGDQIGPF